MTELVSSRSASSTAAPSESVTTVRTSSPGLKPVAATVIPVVVASSTVTSSGVAVTVALLLLVGGGLLVAARHRRTLAVPSAE